jgi:prepilin-type N-terminal cleavage/methylation domain-containing protein
MNLSKDKQGFTIVELLIVIVVIGILAAITIVAFNGVTDKARAAAAKSYASQIKRRDIGDAQGYWNFDECTGANLANTGGGANSNGNTVTGTTAFSNDTPNGSGCSLSLNGSSYIMTNVGLSNTYYEKSLWFKTAITGGAMNLVSDAIGSGSGTAFYLNNSLLMSGHNGDWGIASSTVRYNDNKWHFALVEYKTNASGSDGTLTLTVDGAKVTSVNVPAITNPSNVQSIGSFGTSSYYQGLIDDVMIVTK